MSVNCPKCGLDHIHDFAKCRSIDDALLSGYRTTTKGESNCGCEWGQCGCVTIDLDPWEIFAPWEEFCIKDPDLCTPPPVLEYPPDLPALVVPAFKCPPMADSPACKVKPPPTPAYSPPCPDVSTPECAIDLPAIPPKPVATPIVPAEIIVPVPPCPGDGEIRCSEADFSC